MLYCCGALVPGHRLVAGWAVSSCSTLERQALTGGDETGDWQRPFAENNSCDSASNAGVAVISDYPRTSAGNGGWLTMAVRESVQVAAPSGVYVLFLCAVCCRHAAQVRHPRLPSRSPASWC